MIEKVAKELGLWKKVEIVGDIAIVGIPFGKDVEDVKEYAQLILKEIPYVRSVWGKYRDIKGDFRLSTSVHLAGEKRSETIYKEYGCKFFLDITKVFYSSKLSYEHTRVARLVRRGEIIINMFSGYGPFSIMSYVLGGASIVYSIDINPYAYYYMMANIDLNKAYGVIPVYGDAFKKMDHLPYNVDRILAPLPERAREAYEIAIPHLRRGGVLHLYTEIEGEDPIKIAKSVYPNVVFARVVRSVKPKVYHVVVDIKKDQE
ncbi:tRNA 4-demethylwyosine(37)-methyltransferase Taw21 [Stygiolobus caldivivus]|uniref:Methyltransferase n=1 Tax=Stygiolobus caldivivus TaxID=2824673 RepID=A0A8D5U4X3_9CREN|nr:class I SAM-dependent methyltransferase family protein [Stygiolobus caldivivus]BCU69506.1 methyltransferase [Stygiolobus caldivivus]